MLDERRDHGVREAMTTPPLGHCCFAGCTLTTCTSCGAERCINDGHLCTGQVLRYQPGPRAAVPVDLRDDGVLWMVNRTVFHPRGYALAVDDTGTLTLLGDGSEPWSFDLRESDGTDREDELFRRFLALLDRAALLNTSAT